ncbi:hypothetical protein ACWDX6_14490 [Streptomyces sp. NPDC003027]|jgi:hypothetical protein|uniref:Uncharacterized protein n=1 Tax=uncultured soil bacterium V167 TaxID=684592 RepID=D3U1V6_9BACT|nr:hypothetical [uncultured soil bacterium V167]
MKSLWSLREDVRLRAAGAGGDVHVLSGSGTVRLRCPHPLVLRALDRMTLGPSLLENVTDDRSGPEHPLLVPVLTRLAHLVVRSLGPEDLGGPLLSVVPIADDARFRPGSAGPDQRVRLAAGVAFRAGENGPVMVAAGGRYCVEMHRAEVCEVVRVIGRRGCLGRSVRALPTPISVSCEILRYFAGTGMVTIS